jgi:hypothetical protein
MRKIFLDRILHVLEISNNSLFESIWHTQICFRLNLDQNYKRWNVDKTLQYADTVVANINL